MRGRAERTQPPADGQAEAAFEPGDITGLFVAPRWLRDLGTSAWFLVGVGLAVVGAVAILALTQTIVAPVITAGVVAAVASPLVARAQARGMNRGLAAALVLLGLIAISIAAVVIIVGGITGEADA